MAEAVRRTCGQEPEWETLDLSSISDRRGQEAWIVGWGRISLPSGRNFIPELPPLVRRRSRLQSDHPTRASTTRLAIDPRAAEAETSSVTTIMTTGVYNISVALLTAAWLSCPAPAIAQSYTIQKPGELPTHVRATPGGATVSKSGELPTYVRTTPGGGATISKPGELPTYVRPSPGGGATISKPGSLPTYVRPSSNGGATISRPGEQPIHVRTTPGGFTVQKAGELPTYIRKTGSGKDAMTAADVVKYLPAVTDGADKKKAGKR
jgi:hypothetical protein